MYLLNRAPSWGGFALPWLGYIEIVSVKYELYFTDSSVVSGPYRGFKKYPLSRW